LRPLRASLRGAEYQILSMFNLLCSAGKTCGGAARPYQPDTTRKTGFPGTSGRPLITRSLASISS
jgi:hypothetical protein